MKWSLLVLLCSMSAMATNGGNLIGLSATSVGMGGTGMAQYQGVMESIHKNTSLLTLQKGASGLGAEFSNTFVSINVKGTGSTAAGEKTSQAKSHYIADIAASYRLNDSMAIGLGVLPYAGAKFDFSGEASFAGLKTDNTIIKIQPAFAYSPVENLSFGAAPIIGYGSLALNDLVTGTQSTRDPSTGVGVSGQLSASYKCHGLVFGAGFTAPLKITYKSVSNLDAFGPNAAVAASAGLDDLAIQQPSELALGVAYEIAPEWAVTLDYRNLGWSHADVYKELGWKSQNVISFGTQYRMDKLALRLGFNYAKSPIEDAAGEVGLTPVDLQGHTIFQSSVSKLDVLGFPPIATTHITVGAGYEFTGALGADLALMYSPKVTVTRAGANATTAYTYTNTMSQMAVTLGVRYAFN